MGRVRGEKEKVKVGFREEKGSINTGIMVVMRLKTA